ncbi:hypothetical protein M3Y98_00354400 [Aphelenchoides besseyi]|nr:hypothetical protein M3Y98_00354400 [Aphelenchoides besseyi]
METKHLLTATTSSPQRCSQSNDSERRTSPAPVIDKYERNRFLRPRIGSRRIRNRLVQKYGIVNISLVNVPKQHRKYFRYATDSCPLTIMTMCVQFMTGVVLQTLMAGVIFAKLARPIKRAATILFSKHAVICQRDGKLCLLFRVGDMRKSSLAEAHIRLQMIKKCVTLENEVLPFHQFDMNVGYDSGLDRVFVIWPITICHEIDESSPLYDVSKKSLANSRFEIIAILEGVVESVGSTTQARTSYLPNEILFEKLVTYQRDNGEYLIDFEKFHNVFDVDMPECSARELDEMRNEYDLTLHMQAMFIMSWRDTRLIWEPRDFGNITKIPFDDHKVQRFWLPKVTAKAILIFGNRHMFGLRNSFVSGNNVTQTKGYDILNFTLQRYYITTDGMKPQTTEDLSYTLTKNGEKLESAITMGSVIHYQFFFHRNVDLYVPYILLPIYVGTLLVLLAGAVDDLKKSLTILVFAIFFQFNTLFRVSLSLPPNYLKTPFCMKYGIAIFVETIVLLIYKIAYTSLLQNFANEKEVITNFCTINRYFKYFVFIQAIFCTWLLFF